MTASLPRRARRTAFLAAFLLAAASSAFAGEFLEEKGVAVGGYDPVAYVTRNAPVRGVKKYRVVHRGSTFLFASAANRDSFANDPERWAPQYAGYCAYGTANGYKAAVDPAAFTIWNGRLYLNYNAEVLAKWRSDIPGYVEKADAKWPEVAKTSKVYR